MDEVIPITPLISQLRTSITDQGTYKVFIIVDVRHDDDYENYKRIRNFEVFLFLRLIIRSMTLVSLDKLSKWYHLLRWWVTTRGSLEYLLRIIKTRSLVSFRVFPQL